MSKFEFTITIVSIVIAFALCELMAGWGRLLRQRPTPRIDPLFAGWSVGILLLAIAHWSGLWLYVDVSFESLRQLFVLLAPPLLLVPIAFLLSPDPQADRPLDLAAHFAAVSRPTLLLVAAFSLASLAADVVVGGVSLASGEPLATLAWTGLVVAAAISQRRALGIAALAILWLSLLGFVFGLTRAPGW